MKAGTDLSVLAFFMPKLYQIMGDGVNGQVFFLREKSGTVRGYGVLGHG